MLKSPHVVVIDGMNFMHRAASFAAQNPGPLVVKSALMTLRALVESTRATRAIIVMEGCPRDRLRLFDAYKANRVRSDGTDTVHDDFVAWCNVAILTIAQWLPVSVIRHPNFEADDVVHTVISNSSRAVPFTIVSTDTDFIQELDTPNVLLWNPVRKIHEHRREYDYVTWKALRGDPGDGIPGFHGIGDKKAQLIASDPARLLEFLEDPQRAELFVRNYELIKLVAVPEVELDALESSQPTRDWDALRAHLTELGVRQIVVDPYWTRFTSTFDELFGDVKVSSAP